MNSETGKNSESAGHGDPKTLEADVRRAVEQGEDIQENVRRLTLMALGGEPLDLKTLRRTMSAVVDGARDGIQRQLQETTAQAQMSRAKMGEAVVPGNSALLGPSFLGALGFVGALIGGLLLLLSVWKSGGTSQK